MSKSINTFCAIIFLGLSMSNFGFIIAENLVHQSDDWWKEFVHDGPSAPSTIHSVELDDQQDEPFQIEQSLDTEFPIENGEGSIGVDPIPEEASNWFSQNKKLLVGMGVAFFGGYGLRMWWYQGGFSLQAMQEFDQAVANGDMNKVKQILGGSLDTRTQIQLAARNTRHCPICLTDIDDPAQYQVTTSNCFHFICVNCKQGCQRSGRSYCCPVCRRS